MEASDYALEELMALSERCCEQKIPPEEFAAALSVGSVIALAGLTEGPDLGNDLTLDVAEQVADYAIGLIAARRRSIQAGRN